MKTIKIKVQPSEEHALQIQSALKDLEWLWNKARWVALHNQCINWYKWAKKQKVDLDGCVLVPLRFSRRGAWNGASCAIATGGPYFKKDEKAPLINYRIKKNSKWEPRTRHGHRLVTGDRPYIQSCPVAHRPLDMQGKELKSVSALDAKGVLNRQRKDEGLEPFNFHSDFIGGMLKDFETAWIAYTDPQLQDRSMPKYKDGRENTLSTLNNAQNPPKLKDGVFDCGGYVVTPCDRTWQKRLGDLIPRSYKLTQKPSGWYLCISAATPSEALRPTLAAHRNAIAKTVTKGLKSKKDKDTAKVESSEYQVAVQALKDLENQIQDELLLASACHRRTGHAAGVDPGVKSIVGLDGGQLFNPNESRGRIAEHIERLQKKLDNMRDRNDKRMGLKWRQGQRSATKNEDKIQAQISRLHERGANSSNMFNHKLATRLGRTYDFIAWEATQIKNMSKGVEPKLAENGNHYEQNGANAKAGLNRSLKHTCMGDLKAKTKSRMEQSRKIFVESPAKDSSITCHSCGNKDKTQRVEQAVFICANELCGLYDQIQNADVNAAKNHKKNGLANCNIPTKSFL